MVFGIGKKPSEEEIAKNAFEEGVSEGQRIDAGMAILESPATGDFTKLFGNWAKPVRIDNAPASELIIPSFSTTNYGKVISESFELYTARNQIAAVLLCIVEPLEQAFPQAGFQDYLSMLIVPLEVDNKSRRSMDGFYVKEIGTKRAFVEQKREKIKPRSIINAGGD
jgi:hypothetical protein